MANLKSIKSKILSYKKTGTVTHAMEAVSAVKMRKTQERALNARSYAAAALSILERLSGAVSHPLMQEKPGRTAIIVITSDKGLAGSLNSAVIRSVEKEIEHQQLKKDEVVILAFGKRGGDYFGSRDYYVTETRANVGDDVLEGDVFDIVNTQILSRSDDMDVGKVFVAYQNFISTFEQEPVIRQILPITPELIREFVAGIRPAKGKYAGGVEKAQERSSVYTIEPDAETVLQKLLPKLLNISIFHAMLESKASEHSARMVAMKNATDKAKEMAQELTRTFNKVRQAAITREVSEITSGIEAMK